MPIGWLDTIKSFFSAQVNKSRVDFDDFIKDQHDLEKRLQKTIVSLQAEISSIRNRLDKSSTSVPQDLRPLRAEQKRLENILYRIGLSLKSLAELRREAAEWRRLSLFSGTSSELHESRLREHVVRAEITLRDYLSGTPLPLDEGPSARSSASTDLQESAHASAGLPDVAVDSGHRYIVRLSYVDPDDSILHIPSEHLVARIKELSNELARSVLAPSVDSAEIISTVRELQSMHQALRKSDRRNSMRRDRLSLTDGFRHIFPTH